MTKKGTESAWKIRFGRSTVMTCASILVLLVGTASRGLAQLVRTLWVDVDSLGDVPESLTKDGLPPNRDSLGRIETPDGPVPILMERVPRGDGVSIWQISSATVHRIPALWKRFGPSPMWKLFPSALLDNKVGALLPPGGRVAMSGLAPCAARTMISGPSSGLRRRSISR